MPNVKLISFTGHRTDDERWYAARLLAYTKNTRLEMTPDSLEVFNRMPIAQLERELDYMASSIASSWEFISVTFLLTKVSQACMRQITRTRVGASFAVQSQRVTNMSDVTVYIPETVPADSLVHYQLACTASLASYEKLVKDGVSYEDARGILPMNTHVNLLAQYSFRAWVDLVRSRDSLRVQREYRKIIGAMKSEVLTVWPWAATFIEPKQAKAIALMEELAGELVPEQRTRLAKAADLLKKETA